MSACSASSSSSNFATWALAASAICPISHSPSTTFFNQYRARAGSFGRPSSPLKNDSPSLIAARSEPIERPFFHRIGHFHEIFAPRRRAGGVGGALSLIISHRASLFVHAKLTLQTAATDSVRAMQGSPFCRSLLARIPAQRGLEQANHSNAISPEART